MFLLTLLACWATLAGMRRVYLAVAAMPMERLIDPPASQLPKTVKPTLLPPEPQSPDFGYREEARAMERRSPAPAAKAQGAPSRALPAKPAAAAAEGPPPPTEEVSKPPPVESAKAKSSGPRLTGADARAKQLLEQARRRAGRLQAIGFKQGETMMMGDTGAGAAPNEPEHPKLRPVESIHEEEGPQSGGSSHAPAQNPNSAAPRSMRPVSYGGSTSSSRPAVQRQEEAPAVIADPVYEEEGE